MSVVGADFQSGISEKWVVSLALTVHPNAGWGYIFSTHLERNGVL